MTLYIRCFSACLASPQQPFVSRLISAIHDLRGVPSRGTSPLVKVAAQKVQTMTHYFLISECPSKDHSPVGHQRPIRMAGR